MMPRWGMIMLICIYMIYIITHMKVLPWFYEFSPKVFWWWLRSYEAPMDGLMEKPHMGLIDVMMCPHCGWCGWSFNHDGFGAEWGCHSVAAWLTQANTNGQAWYITFDGFIILKTYMYMYMFFMYMYYDLEYRWSLALPWLSNAIEGLGQFILFLKWKVIIYKLNWFL